MAKNMKKKQKSGVVGVLLMAVVFFLLLDAILVLGIRFNKNPDSEGITEGEPLSSSVPEITDEITVPETTEAVPEVETIALPAVLEDNRLRILSLFQYSGPNPDCGDREGKDTAGILLENASQYHLSRAELEIVTASGMVLRFVVEDIPAGKTVMVFSADNAPVEVDPRCVEITCNAEFAEAAPLQTGSIRLTVTGTTIRITNISGKDLENVVVHYHNVMDPEYYGGITYQYLIEDLPAGGSKEFDAWECFFGVADVVRIEMEG